MAINPDRRISYTCQPSVEVKKTSLFSKIMGPLRRAIGSGIGKELGEIRKASGIRLSKTEKAELTAKKLNFLDRENVESLTIVMKNRKGEETHQLDGIFINNPNDLDTDNKEKKYVLVFLGMGDCYEKHLDALGKLREDTNTTVVAFNYRGKMDSSGSANSAKDYVEDGRALVEYLVNSKGARVLYGHSLGGGVAAKLSEELDHKGPIISESSFSAFKKAVKHKKGAFSSWILQKTGWNIRGMDALENQDRLGIIVNRRDPTVHYKKSSLYNEFKRKGVDKELHVIKIGKDASKEDKQTPMVKIAPKNFKKSAKAQDALIETERNASYRNIQKDLKKAGWLQYLRHPHQMVIDQPSESEIELPEKIREELAKLKSKADANPKSMGAYTEKETLASELVALNKKYAQEDQLAYEGIVGMIKTLLQI